MDSLYGERLCLHRGQDRTDASDDGPIRLIDLGGTALPGVETPLVFRAVHRSTGGESFDASGVVAMDSADKVAVIQIPASLHAALPRGCYRYFAFEVVGAEQLVGLDIVGDLHLGEA